MRQSLSTISVEKEQYYGNTTRTLSFSNLELGSLDKLAVISARELLWNNRVGRCLAEMTKSTPRRLENTNLQARNTGVLEIRMIFSRWGSTDKELAHISSEDNYRNNPNGVFLCQACGISWTKWHEKPTNHWRRFESTDLGRSGHLVALLGPLRRLAFSLNREIASVANETTQTVVEWQ